MSTRERERRAGTARHCLFSFVSRGKKSVSTRERERRNGFFLIHREKKK
jgi:hypothetical protein